MVRMHQVNTRRRHRTAHRREAKLPGGRPKPRHRRRNRCCRDPSYHKQKFPDAIVAESLHQTGSKAGGGLATRLCMKQVVAQRPAWPITVFRNERGINTTRQGGRTQARQHAGRRVERDGRVLCREGENDELLQAWDDLILRCSANCRVGRSGASSDAV